MLRGVSRFWLPLLVLVAVAIGGFVVFRIQGVFGSDNEITREGSGIADDPAPFNPKRVTYEVFGPAGAVATINYLDLSANPQSVKHAPLPWSLTLTTTSRAVSRSCSLMAAPRQSAAVYRRRNIKARRPPRALMLSPSAR